MATDMTIALSDEARHRRWQLVRALVDAAIAHGAAVCDSAMALGDLEVLLFAALRLLAPGALATFWADDDVRDLVADTPEYAAVAREVYGESGDDAGD